MKRAIIIGGGFTGFTWARLLAERANRYIGNLPEGIISVGRLETYRYMGMNDIIHQAFERIGDY